MTAPTSLQQEILGRFAAAGLAVPADLQAGVITEAQDLLRLTALLRRPRDAAAEPFAATWPAIER